MSDAMQTAIGVLNEKIDQASAPSDWFEMTQDRINMFADATMDHQWIHVDPERAKAGPFGAPIAHGQLTMSIMSFLPGGEDIGIPPLDGVKMGVNYGCGKIRFPAPVPVGSKIRGGGELTAVEEIKGGYQATVVITVENQAPLADARADDTAPILSTVTLDGTFSADPDACDTLTSYAWTQTAGTPVVLSDATAAQRLPRRTTPSNGRKAARPPSVTASLFQSSWLILLRLNGS